MILSLNQFDGEVQSNATHRQLRQIGASNFHQFEQNRQNQAILHRSDHPRNARSMMSVLVRSKAEEQLMAYIKHTHLPKVSPVKRKKGQRTDLEKILGNKAIFMRTYFCSLKEGQRERKREQVKEVFDSFVEGGWTIRGCLKGGFLILKAERGGAQKYFKVREEPQVHEDYRGFVRRHVQMDL